MDFSKNKVLTFEQGCEYLGYAKSYCYKLTSSNILPFSKPNGKSIYFDREKLEAWMLSNPSTSMAEKQIEAATYISTHRLDAANVNGKREYGKEIQVAKNQKQKGGRHNAS